jgi:predicted nucleic acid-binding protein
VPPANACSSEWTTSLIVAVMQQHGLTALASHDADFDRVPGITRHAPG